MSRRRRSQFPDAPREFAAGELADLISAVGRMRRKPDAPALAALANRMLNEDGPHGHCGWRFVAEGARIEAYPTKGDADAYSRYAPSSGRDRRRSVRKRNRVSEGRRRSFEPGKADGPGFAGIEGRPR